MAKTLQRPTGVSLGRQTDRGAHFRSRRAKHTRLLLSLTSPSLLREATG